MKVRIGIAETDRIIELEVEDPKEFEASVEEAFSADGSLLWFEDTKRRRVGIPRRRIAFIEIETEAERQSVGFSPS